MDLKVLELSDLSERLGLTESITEPGVWYVIREKPPILAIQDHGLPFLCRVCEDDGLVEDQFNAMIDFTRNVLYAPGVVNGEPYFPVLN